MDADFFAVFLIPPQPSKVAKVTKEKKMRSTDHCSILYGQIQKALY